MKNSEKILNRIRSVDWSTANQSTDFKDLEGATIFLKMYARFLLDNQQSSSYGVTPFASPIQVLGLTDIRVQQAIVDEIQLLIGKSPLAYDKVFVTRAFEWVALCDSGHPSTQGREAMFDPLIELAINRIPTMVRKGHWVVDESMYPISDWVGRYSRL